MSDNTSIPNHHPGSPQGQNQECWIVHHEQCPCGYPPPFYLRAPKKHKQSTSESIQSSASSTSERSLYDHEPGMRSDNVSVPTQYKHHCHFMDLHQTYPPLHECLHDYYHNHSVHNHQRTGYNSALFEVPSYETAPYEASSDYTEQKPLTSCFKTTPPNPAIQSTYQSPFISSPSPTKPNSPATSATFNHSTPPSPSTSQQTMNSSNESLFSQVTWDNLMKDPNLINMIQEIDGYFCPSDTTSLTGSWNGRSRSSNNFNPVFTNDEGSSQSLDHSQGRRSLEVDDGSFGSFGSSGSNSGSGHHQFGDRNGDEADNRIDPEHHSMRISNFYIKLKPTSWGNQYLSTQQEGSRRLDNQARATDGVRQKESHDMKLAAELNKVKMLMSQLDQSLAAVQVIIADGEHGEESRH